MYTIYDNIAKAFQNPFYQLNDGSAVRMFTQAINDEDSILSKQPNDFALYYTGEFDEQSGNLLSLEMPEKIIQGSQVAIETKSQNKINERLENIENLLGELIK